MIHESELGLHCNSQLGRCRNTAFPGMNINLQNVQQELHFKNGNEVLQSLMHSEARTGCLLRVHRHDSENFAKGSCRGKRNWAESGRLQLTVTPALCAQQKKK